jgi:Notch-like protein
MALYIIGSPCEHDGICVNTAGSYKCDCKTGFKGRRCEVNINECESNPCQNEGTCIDERGGFRCICMPGKTLNQVYLKLPLLQIKHCF